VRVWWEPAQRGPIESGRVTSIPQWLGREGGRRCGACAVSVADITVAESSDEFPCYKKDSAASSAEIPRPLDGPYMIHWEIGLRRLRGDSCKVIGVVRVSD